MPVFIPRPLVYVGTVLSCLYVYHRPKALGHLSAWCSYCYFYFSDEKVRVRYICLEITQLMGGFRPTFFTPNPLLTVTTLY